MTREEAIKEAYGIPVTKAQHEALQILIPELAENDDERIRKELISFVNKYYGEETKKEVIAYLEKQKEQKPVKIDDDTEVGLDRALQIVKAAKGNLCGYQSDDGIYECCHAIQTLERILKNGIEQKPTEWSEEDKDYFDAIIAKLEVTQDDAMLTDNQFNFLKSLRPLPKQEWSEEDDAIHTRVLGALGKAFMGVLPTKPSQEDIEWFKSLPKRFNFQPKQEWSEGDEAAFGDIEQARKSAKDENDMGIWFAEKWVKERIKSFSPQSKQKWGREDEDMLELIINHFEYPVIPLKINTADKVVDYKEIAAWLKSFPSRFSLRPHWKPSKEQINALKVVARGYPSDDRDAIESLLNELQKLM